MAPAGTSTSQTSRINGMTFGLATNTLTVGNNKQLQQHTHQADRAGLRGHVQFNEYTHTHTHTHTQGAFSRDCTFLGCRGGVLTINRQPVGPLVRTAAITTATVINHVDSGSFSSRCCTLRRTHTSADPIRILCIRLALTLTLSRPPGFASCARLMVCVSPCALWVVGDFSCDCMFWDDWGGGLTGQPMGPQVDTANMRTVLSTNHVDSRSFSPRCWAFRRTHPSANPIRLLCIRLALPLTLSLPSGFVPSTQLVVGASLRALGLVGDCSCDGMFWDDREEDLLGNRWAHRWIQQT